jgi:hypothetical protein
VQKILSIIGGIVCAFVVSVVCVILFAALSDGTPAARPKPIVVQAAAGDPPREFATTYTPVPNAAPTRIPVATQPPPAEPLRVTDVAMRITETNDVFTRFSWQATLTNQTGQPLEFSVDAQFLDADGFVLDYDRVYAVSVPAQSAIHISDFALITHDVAPQVASMQIQIVP